MKVLVGLICLASFLHQLQWPIHFQDQYSIAVEFWIMLKQLSTNALTSDQHLKKYSYEISSPSVEGWAGTLTMEWIRCFADFWASPDSA